MLKIYKDKDKICGLQAFYLFKDIENKEKIIPGLKMVLYQPEYTIKSIELEKGDYLKGILGCVDQNKHFTYLKFVTKKGRLIKVGKKAKTSIQQQRVFSLKIAPD
jgi:hypothetical protein